MKTFFHFLLALLVWGLLAITCFFLLTGLAGFFADLLLPAGIAQEGVLEITGLFFLFAAGLASLVVALYMVVYIMAAEDIHILPFSSKFETLKLRCAFIYFFPACGFFGLFIFLIYFWTSPQVVGKLILIAFPFYFGSLLLTIPVNFYAVIMFVFAARLHKRQQEIWIHYRDSGILTVVISIAFIISLMMGYVLTA